VEESEIFSVALASEPREERGVLHHSVHTEKETSEPGPVENKIKIGAAPSRLPSYSDSAESIGKDRQFSEHRGEPLDQRQQPHLWHGGDQLVEHAALSEQRMGASLGSV
jgi:hypothetical protein